MASYPICISASLVRKEGQEVAKKKVERQCSEGRFNANDM
jgi:hypothetical protein